MSQKAMNKNNSCAMDYPAALAWLNHLETFGIRLGLQRIEKLLQLLGNPQERYKTIHITGTNGKGSVSALLAGVMQASGIHAGFYSSPHLVSYTERVRVDGDPVSEAEFASGLSIVRRYVEQMFAAGEECPTQFEVLTALAFYLFAEHHVEYAVIEVGLGGRLDSTNVIVPEVSVITNVTFEHAAVLGGTLESIADNKAGIIKQGVPVVTAAQGLPLEIIRQRAAEQSADLFVSGVDFRAEPIGCDGRTQTLSFSSPLLGIVAEPFALQLLGHYQVENAAVAIMTACLLHNSDARINSETIHQALRLTTWAARFERLDLAGQAIIVDGAHNPAGMKELRASLDAIFPAEERVLLLGILRDKDIDQMLHILLRADDTVVVTTPQSSRAEQPDNIARQAAPLCQHVEAFADNAEALARARELAGKKRLLVLAGSLYLVGGLRAQLLAAAGKEKGHE